MYNWILQSTKQLIRSLHLKAVYLFLNFYLKLMKLIFGKKFAQEIFLNLKSDLRNTLPKLYEETMEQYHQAGFSADAQLSLLRNSQQAQKTYTKMFLALKSSVN